MQPFANLKTFFVSCWSWIVALSICGAPPRDYDEANRSAYLDDVFHVAMLGPHV